MKVVVVGAGLSGLTAARLFRNAGHKVTIYDTQEELGGACSVSKVNGVDVHTHGPHIFHTNNLTVARFIEGLTTVTPYNHKVSALTDTYGKLPIPYSDRTEQITGKISDAEIIDAIFNPYSLKMWGKKFTDLPKEITERVPVRRAGYTLGYFTDKYQGILDYKKLFNALAAGSDVRLGVGPNTWRKDNYDFLVYTGSMDEFYKEPGILPYQTLVISFEEENPCGMDREVINECRASKAATRYTDYSMFNLPGTKSVYSLEIPIPYVYGEDIPYYPIPFGEGPELYKEYRDIKKPSNVVFLGRLGTYKYINMDAAISQAMQIVEPVILNMMW